MSNHTKAPWFVGELDRKEQRIVCGSDFEICTCWHHCVGSIAEEMEANARLIAAAPDLLAACKQAAELLASMKRSKQAVPSSTIYGLDAIASSADALDDAIAKAEGKVTTS